MSWRFFDFLDEFFSQTRVLEIHGEKYIIKKYSRELGIIKWFIVKTASRILNIYPYASDPVERMRRETIFFISSDVDVKHPRIYLMDWINNIVIREYVPGEPISPLDRNVYPVIGEILARIHYSGYVLGDTKFFNFLRTPENEIYLIDAEQAIRSGDSKHRAWDLIVFIITIMYRLISLSSLVYPEKYLDNIDAFIEAYSQHYEDYRSIFEEFGRASISNVVMMLLPPPFNAYLLKTLKDYSKRI